jgi:hopanoid-associated phosphorylase
VTAHEAHEDAPIVVVCGLAFEARAAAGVGIAAVCSGNQRQLATMLRAAVGPSTRGIISFGCAAALAPDVRTGDCVVARNVLSLGEAFVADPQWSAQMLAAVPTAVHADIASVDRPIQLPAEKRSLNARTGALAVDMESHIAGRIARERGLPFAALRVVLDPAERAVPRAALAGHKPDGSTDAWAVASALWRRPRELPAVMRLAIDAVVASRALLRCRRQLGERLAFVDVGHHPLDVA